MKRENKIKFTVNDLDNYVFTSHIGYISISQKSIWRTRKMRLLEGDEICYHQHQKIVLVLIDFQNKTIIVQTTSLYTKYSYL